MRIWQDDAACRGTEVDMVPSQTRGQEVQAAKRVCAPCPVREQCLAAAERALQVEALELQGVWGGFSLAERERLRAGLPPRNCAACGLVFVGSPKIDVCDTCFKRGWPTLIASLESEIRRMIQNGARARKIAARLGLDRGSLFAWLRTTFAAEKVAPLLVEPPPREPPQCGTDAARTAHRKAMLKAGQKADLSKLTCKCRTFPLQPSARPGQLSGAQKRKKKKTAAGA